MVGLISFYKKKLIKISGFQQNREKYRKIAQTQMQKRHSVLSLKIHFLEQAYKPNTIVPSWLTDPERALSQRKSPVQGN